MTSLERMKQDNEKRILKVVYEEPGIYRKMVAKRTDLSSQAVTNLVSELLEKKLLLESSNRAEGRGRVPVSLHLNYAKIFIMTVDLELNQRSVYLHALDHTILASDVTRLWGSETITEYLKQRIAVVMQKAGAGCQIQALVIGIAGVVNEDTGIVVEAQKLHLHNVNMKEEFAYLGVPVLVRNDVNLIAAYEKTVCKEDMNFMVAKIDIGIGSSIVVGSRVLKSTNNVAGELGHVSVSSEEVRPCSCGKSNCLTKFISRDALEQSYGKSYEDLVLDVRQGEPRAIAQVENICTYLAPMLANVITLLDLDRVILCGCTVENFTDIIYPLLEQKIRERLSYWLAFKGLKVHSDINIVQISTQFWLDYFFSTEGVQILTETV